MCGFLGMRFLPIWSNCAQSGSSLASDDHHVASSAHHWPTRNGTVPGLLAIVRTQ